MAPNVRADAAASPVGRRDEHRLAVDRRLVAMAPDTDHELLHERVAHR